MLSIYIIEFFLLFIPTLFVHKWVIFMSQSVCCVNICVEAEQRNQRKLKKAKTKTMLQGAVIEFNNKRGHCGRILQLWWNGKWKTRPLQQRSSCCCMCTQTHKTMPYGDARSLATRCFVIFFWNHMGAINAGTTQLHSPNTARTIKPTVKIMQLSMCQQLIMDCWVPFKMQWDVREKAGHFKAFYLLHLFLCKSYYEQDKEQIDHFRRHFKTNTNLIRQLYLAKKFCFSLFQVSICPPLERHVNAQEHHVMICVMT